MASSAAANALNSISAVNTSETDTVGWVESGAVGADVDADSAVGLVLLSAAGGEEVALAVNVSVVGLTGLAETNVVNGQTVVGSLVTNALNSDFVGLADDVGVVDEASAGVIDEIAAHTLLAVAGHQIVPLTVELRVDALSEAESLPLCATGQRRNDAFALTVDDGGIGVFAAETVTSEIVPSQTEGRNVDAENSVS